jgi:hypothetical protein
MRYDLNLDLRPFAPDLEMEWEIGGLTWSPARSLNDAIRLARGSGLYKIFKNGDLLYIGETGDLRDRFMNHRQCVVRFDVPGTFTVKYASFTGSKASRLRVQNNLIEYYRNRKGFNITNIREIEEELTGDY